MTDIAGPRDLPSVDQLLRTKAIRDLGKMAGEAMVAEAVREALQGARRELLGGCPPIAPGALPLRVEERIRQVTQPRLRSVINATGVVIHTNLGRAPLSGAALTAVARAAEGYSNLEYDLASGERGSRHSLVTEHLRRLTGAEDALVVNNNAASVLLILSALASGREVVVSRGQLVEIGGGVRIPDILRQSGAVLREVGTTNRTYARDFQDACVPERTALLLRVHTSNFLQVGFVTQPSLGELVEVARQNGVAVVDDVGSGTFLDTVPFGLAREPMVQESVAAGAALVCFSGDKLLGGPQAGIIVGALKQVAELKRHPLVRAVRPDKMTIAALEATLLHYIRGEAEHSVPVWQIVGATIADLENRGAALIGRLGTGFTLIPSRAAVGGGSLPGQTLPSRAVAVCTDGPDRLAAALRRADPPVICRIEQDQVLLDLRTVLPEQDELLARVAHGVLQGAAG